MRRSSRVVITLAIMAIFATGAYAFTAANSVPESSAGFGGAAITGYAVSDIHYTLGENSDCESSPLPDDENNFGNCLIGISFNLTGANAPTDVTVHFDVPDPQNQPPHLYSDECTITGGGPWLVECDILEFAASAEFLRIAAAQ